MPEPVVDSRRRFAMIPEALLSDRSLPDSAVRVFGALHRFGRSPETCYPSITRIAEMAGTNASAVKKALTALEESGWIRRVNRFLPSGLKASNGYELHDSPMGQNTPIDGSEHTHPKGRNPRSLDGSIPNQRWVGFDPMDGSDSTPTDGSESTHKREPSQPEPGKREGRGPQSSSSLTNLAAFEEFCRAYPHAVKLKAAKAAWQWATRKTDPAEIIKGARAYADYAIRTGEKQQFLEEPADWLSRGGWTDRREPLRPHGWTDGMSTGVKLTVAPEKLGLTWADMIDPEAMRAASGTGSA